MFIDSISAAVDLNHALFAHEADSGPSHTCRRRCNCTGKLGRCCEVSFSSYSLMTFRIVRLDVDFHNSLYLGLSKRYGELKTIPNRYLVSSARLREQAGSSEWLNGRLTSSLAFRALAVETCLFRPKASPRPQTCAMGVFEVYYTSKTSTILEL